MCQLSHPQAYSFAHIHMKIFYALILHVQPVKYYKPYSQSKMKVGKNRLDKHKLIMYEVKKPKNKTLDLETMFKHHTVHPPLLNLIRWITTVLKDFVYNISPLIKILVTITVLLRPVDFSLQVSSE